jgi:hypothetical protein|tara:strand:+ start:507 stop:1037 length:531 start_codon:yes stop_codon:yes gene_type:complete
MAETNYTSLESQTSTIKEREVNTNQVEGILPISPAMMDPQTAIPVTGTPVTLIRQAFDKDKFKETVKTEFTELGVTEVDLSFFDPNLATVGDFFSIYNTLFYLIPMTGPNSHTTIVEESSQYIDYKANQVEIQALLDEIAELREQNLQLTVDIGNVLGAQETIDSALAEVNQNKSI